MFDVLPLIISYFYDLSYIPVEGNVNKLNWSKTEFVNLVTKYAKVKWKFVKFENGNCNFNTVVAHVVDMNYCKNFLIEQILWLLVSGIQDYMRN